MNQKLKERYRIAFGLDARPRAQALKAWNMKWNNSFETRINGSWVKSSGYATKAAGPAQLASKTSLPSLAVFDAVVTDYKANNAVVALSSDGRTLLASGYEVKALTGAGVDRYGTPLVELRTDLGRSIVRRDAIRRKK